MRRRRILTHPVLLVALLLMACGGDATNPGPGPGSFSNNPCAPTGTLQLAVAQTALIDCTNGGTTLTLAGNGASYLIVPQFPTNLVANQRVPYTLATGNLAAAILSGERAAATRAVAASSLVSDFGVEMLLPRQRQLEFERAITARARRNANPSDHPVPPDLLSPPTLGSTRTFRVLSDFDANTWSTTTAQLAYVGDNILLYIDTGAPANGFTPEQLTAFGRLFDQTLYTIGVSAFGQPSDIDQNGRVIMLMSQIVNHDTPSSECTTLGYVAGFFDAEDFNGPSDPNSNQGEIFYSVVPDPSGTFSCAHTVDRIGETIPATFLHELQHLINYSQHVIVHRGNPGSSWLDEGLSIVAEELGSLYYEQKCPPPACRKSPAQLFPDSSQGFIQGFFSDSYQYALLPDTASITLHNDSQSGFSWRGGVWALSRYLGDRFGNGFFQQLVQGQSDGVAAIAAASGRSFASLFADFGLALYTDSFPGLPRSTAPAVNRFTTRNLRQLWARQFATAGPSTNVPRAMPLQLVATTSDTSTFSMSPGAMSFWRLDTPAADATVSIRFAGPGGGGFSAALHPQIAVFRLPPGQ